MDEEDQGLNSRELAGEIGVHKEGYCDDSVEEKDAVPSLKFVTRIIKHEQALDGCTRNVGDAGYVRLPEKNGHPAGQIGQNSSAGRRCKNGDP